MLFRNRIIRVLMLFTAVIVINFIFCEAARSTDNPQAAIHESLKPGMELKDAIKLLGPPEIITVSDAGTISIPYDALGFSIELMSDGKRIKRINQNTPPKGMLASKPVKEADSKPAGKDNLNKEIPVKETIKIADVPEEVKEQIRAEVRKEVKAEVKAQINQEIKVFEVFGFVAKNRFGKVIITEIKPGSVAESGGLKVGEPVRKASMKGYGMRNIYSVGGLKKILEKAIRGGYKTINILQSTNRYNKVNVPDF